MEFTETEITIIENALFSRKLSLEKTLDADPLPVLITKIYNDEVDNISSLINRFMSEFTKLKSRK